MLQFRGLVRHLLDILNFPIHKHCKTMTLWHMESVVVDPENHGKSPQFLSSSKDFSKKAEKFRLTAFEIWYKRQSFASSFCVRKHRVGRIFFPILFHFVVVLHLDCYLHSSSPLIPTTSNSSELNPSALYFSFQLHSIYGPDDHANLISSN